MSPCLRVCLLLECAIVRPENIIWQFGSGRTGSTWLSRMIHELADFTMWNEPLIGNLVGDMWRWPGHGKRTENEYYIMPEKRPELWVPQLRDFVVSLAEARFPANADYLFVSEPNGAQGAVPLMRAFPDSPLVFLLRDPRDVVASFLAGASGGWAGNRAIEDPDRFVAARSEMVARSFGWSWEAWKEHKGPKTRIRYEDMRADPLKAVSGLLDDLSLPGAGTPELRRSAEKWSWENPKFFLKRGPGEKQRKASPGSWREDLTPSQARTVENTCKSVLDSFYR